jgi:hypothetical protein
MAKKHGLNGLDKMLAIFLERKMTNQIVPFGKYKDKAIEVLQSDRHYLDWLLAQSWFKDRYSDLFTIVINNFQEPTDTPEHNAMHVKFLSDDYVYSLLAPVAGFSRPGRVVSKLFEFQGWDVFVGISNRTRDEFDELLKKNDVSWKGVITAGIFVEIKPSVSDDFPAILRQIKVRKKVADGNFDFKMSVLLVGEYTGKGANQEEFVAFMKNEGIVVIFA